MAYKIQYSQEMDDRYPQVAKKVKMKTGKWLALGLILAGILWIRSNGIPDFLVPGDPQITKSAAVAFMEDITDGTQFHEAVTAFCHAIIDGAAL